MSWLKFTLLAICVSNVFSKCGEGIPTKIGRIWDYVLLYPLTISKVNQSYNMNMVVKEIAYRNEYLGSYNYKYVGQGWITYDFCNDLSTLMEILLDILLDKLYPNPTIVIHADIVFLKSVQPLLNYFRKFSLNLAFINDLDNADMSIYSDESLTIRHELSFGFLEIEQSRILTKNALYVVLCYPEGNSCQCLPFANNKKIISDENVNFVLFLGDYTDVLKLKNTFKTMSHLRNEEIKLFVIQRSEQEWPSLVDQLKDEFEPYVSYLAWRHRVRTRLHYVTHRLNCNNSIFMDKMDKEKRCRQIFTVKTFTGFGKRETFLPDIPMKNFSCKPKCQVGHTIYFNEDRFIWECQLCSNNSVKNNIGNDKCTPCSRGWIPDLNKTMCVDTYKNISLGITDNLSIIMLSVSGVMLSGISYSIFIFIKHIKTPIVKSSNLQMSFCQLLAQLIIVIVMPFLFIGEPNILICTLRPTCIGCLLTISTVVTMSKTRTFLRIFQTGIRLSAKEMLKTKVTEPFIIFLLLLSDVSVLWISFKYQRPDKATFISDEEKYRVKYCNTDNHIIIQFGFIFVLLLFNSIQAVRARHLPANFKETRVIIVANLLSIVIVGNVLWLSFYQKSYYWKSIFLFYAIFLLNGINFIILYAYKIYIIRFIPGMNTKEYFKICIRNKIRKQVDQIAMNRI